MFKPKPKGKPTKKNSPMLKKLAQLAAQQSMAQGGGAMPANPNAQTQYKPNWPQPTPQPSLMQ